MLKKIISITAVFCLLTQFSFAQFETPAPSPYQKITQKVGLTQIDIEYSRPSARGREIFGGLVPYDKIWRTGANKATQFHTDNEIAIKGTKVKAGTYALFTIPGKNNWTIILNKNNDQWGAGDYDKSEDAVRIKVPAKETDSFYETFTIQIADVKYNGANVELKWANTKVAFPVKTFTDEKVQSQIDNVLKADTADAGFYHRAAGFYHMAGKDLNKALEWIQKSNEMEPRFYRYRLEAEIQAELGHFDKAIEAATKSKKLAKEDGNKGYIRMNNESIAKWKQKL